MNTDEYKTFDCSPLPVRPLLSLFTFLHPPVRWRRWLPVAIAALMLAPRAGRAAEPPRDAGWSADLLNQILKAEPARPAPAAAASASSEVVLRTYQLANLRVGEAGRAQNIIAILGKLLPAGSSINADVPANSLHILTTPAAHGAAWNYLSVVDVAEAPAVRPAEIPEDVRAALKKLADTGDTSAKALATVGAFRTDVDRHLAEIDARQQQATWRILVAGAGGLALGGAGLTWLLRRRPDRPSLPAEAATALVPEQLSTALIPVHDRMRNEMLGVLNEVAIKLQAQHEEQQKLVQQQQQQLEGARQALVEERQQFITETGNLVVQAVERVDATTTRLVRQQDKVTELVQELQNTVRELDQTKDDLRDREIQLNQERAKIAALSLLLEEGAGFPAPPPPNGHHSGPPAADDTNNHDRGNACASPAPSPPCTTPDQNPRLSSRLTFEPPSPPAKPTTALRFTFLPPEPRET